MSDEELRKLEEQTLDPGVRSSHERLGALLCDAFREFGSSGRVWNRSEVLTSVPTESGRGDRRVERFQSTRLGQDHALVTYRLTERTGAGVRRTLRSSIWQQDEDGWRMLFHQGTPTD